MIASHRGRGAANLAPGNSVIMTRGDAALVISELPAAFISLKHILIGDYKVNSTCEEGSISNIDFHISDT